MNSLMLAAQTIKDTISARDVGNALGLEIRHGRCQCPIHSGSDFNCVLYPGSRGYYCHVCHSGGDSISFVRNYFKLSFRDAVRWFNDTFNLGMDIDSPLSPEARKQAEKERKRREDAKNFLEWRERMQFDMALTADQIVKAIEKQRDENAPKSADDEWNDKFMEAIELLPAAKRYAEDCIMYCMNVRSC